MRERIIFLPCTDLLLSLYPVWTLSTNSIILAIKSISGKLIPRNWSTRQICATGMQIFIFGVKLIYNERISLSPEWKFWPSEASLSLSIQFQDTALPSEQNFHTVLCGVRNVIFRPDNGLIVCRDTTLAWPTQGCAMPFKVLNTHSLKKGKIKIFSKLAFLGSWSTFKWDSLTKNEFVAKLKQYLMFKFPFDWIN